MNFLQRFTILFFVVSVGLPLVSQSASGQLMFNLIPVDDLAALELGTPQEQAVAATVIAGFNEAAGVWSGIFDDNITVNIDIDFAPLPENVLGGALPARVATSYANVRASLDNDSTSTEDMSVVSNLQSGATLDFLTNARNGSEFRSTPTDAGANVISFTSANAKALGFDTSGVVTGADANITFSSEFAFDFDRGDGISSNQIDFVGVAIHEIGHALGFVSGVDSVDVATGNGPEPPVVDPDNPEPITLNTGTDLNGDADGIGEITDIPFVTVLDLLRFSDDSLAESSQPVGFMSATTGVLDLTTGGDPFLSLDGGVTELAALENGAFNGDGQQASHFLDNLGLGILDPTFAFGELGVVTLNDILALDAIGYNVIGATIPEPTTAALLLVGGAGLIVRRKRSA